MTAVWTVFFCALGAFAFSRLRFRGRRGGMLSLLLVQMFPNLLAVVALFLFMTRIKGLYPAIGLGSSWGLIFIYLGGALGVNTYLIKGFFDTIPQSLDEAAKIDGCTHAQTFFRIILPLAAPVLAVIGLLSFIATQAEFMIASVMLGQNEDSKTLAVGLSQYVLAGFDSRWGPFAAGCVDRRHPGRPAVPLPPAVHRVRAHVRRGQGVGGARRPPAPRRFPALHRTGAARRRRDRPALAAGTGARTEPTGSASGSVPDAEPMLTEARIDTERTTDDAVTWWVADLPLHNPVTELPVPARRRRARDTRGSTPRACTIGTSPTPTTSGSRPTIRRRAWLDGTVGYQIFLDRFAASGERARRARLGHPRHLGHAGRPRTPRSARSSSTAATSPGSSSTSTISNGWVSTSSTSRRSSRRSPRTATTQRRSTTSTRSSAATTRWRRWSSPPTNAASG